MQSKTPRSLAKSSKEEAIVDPQSPVTSKSAKVRSDIVASPLYRSKYSTNQPLVSLSTNFSDRSTYIH